VKAGGRPAGGRRPPRRRRAPPGGRRRGRQGPRRQGQGSRRRGARGACYVRTKGKAGAGGKGDRAGARGGRASGRGGWLKGRGGGLKGGGGAAAPVIGIGDEVGGGREAERGEEGAQGPGPFGALAVGVGAEAPEGGGRNDKPPGGKGDEGAAEEAGREGCDGGEGQEAVAEGLDPVGEPAPTPAPEGELADFREEAGPEDAFFDLGEHICWKGSRAKKWKRGGGGPTKGGGS
jgi:hypothetical protein